MISDTSKILPKTEICEPRINYAKLEGEGDDCSKPVLARRTTSAFASIDQSEALSRADGHHVHPSFSDEEMRTPETCVGKESAIMKDLDNESVVGAVDLGKDLDQALKNKTRMSVEIDIDKYQAYLDDPSLTDEEREELTLLIWQIMMAFVDLGFGVHPVQQACGKTTENTDKASNRDSSMLSSKATTLSDEFNSIAAE